MYINPLTNEVVQTSETLAADHIFPKSQIKDLPGFDDLTPRQQSDLLNIEFNTEGLPKTFNSSKGRLLPGEWIRYKDESLDSGYITESAQRKSIVKQKLINQIKPYLNGEE